MVHWTWQPAKMRHWEPDCRVMHDACCPLSGGHDPPLFTSPDRKECRRLGTRFEKLAINFLAMMKLAMIQRCLKMAFSGGASSASVLIGSSVTTGSGNAAGGQPAGRRRNRPRPTVPQNCPSRAATSPRTVTTAGRPVIGMPSKAL